MPLTLVETSGAANANTFADLAYYKAYIESRVPAPSWKALAIGGTTIDEQLKADLITAARLLNSAPDWTGSAASETQSLSWPRSGMRNRNGYSIASDHIPDALKDAQCELAVQVHNSDLLSNNQAIDKNVSKVKAGSVEVEFQDVDNSLEGMDTTLLLKASDFDWSRLPDKVRWLLVPSWYNRPTLQNRTVEINIL